MSLIGTEANAVLHRQLCLGDRIMCGVAWSLLVLALTLASLHDCWVQAGAVAFGLTGSLQALVLWKPGRRITRVWSALVFMAFSALLINETHGMIEMHFIIFVLLAFLLFYSDWLPLFVAAAAISLHHLAFHLLQAAGYPVWVFPHMCSIGMVVVHAAFVAFETSLLVLMANQHQRSALDAGELIAQLDAVLAGETIDLSLTSKAATGSAGRFGKLIGSLRHLVQSIVQHSSMIAGKLEGIEASAKAVACASDLQQQQIERATVSMQAMRSAVSEISRNSGEIAITMSRSQQDALAGGKVVTGAIQGIQQVASSAQSAVLNLAELETASQSIGKIVDTIESIAGQTNLLALNAAVEAARAGELGRGFAVVASEVRALSERTAQSTKEISVMIDSIQTKSRAAMRSMSMANEQVTQTVRKAGEAGAALQQIIGAAETQSAMITQIASATAEQEIVTERVCTIMGEISGMAEQSSAGAQQSASACSGLGILAVELQALLSRFRIERPRPTKEALPMGRFAMHKQPARTEPATMRSLRS